MPLKPVRALKKGDAIGNDKKILYTIAEDARPGPGGVVTAQVHYAGNPNYEDKLTWLHGADAMVHVHE